MLILHDPLISRSKFLMPVPKKQWMQPSLFVPKDQLGNDTTRTKFRVRARLNDGYVKWVGWFDDREDFDAFLWAIAKGTLKQEKELWKLPTPEWNSDIGENLSYDFATVTYLTTTGTSNTYNVPSDWNNLNNTVECIGAGASGGAIYKSTGVRMGTGGGGGGFGKKSNISLTPSGTTTYGVGVGGVARVTSTNGIAVAGAAGGDTYFGESSYAAASVGGTGGGAGQASGTLAALNGGTAGSGKGDSNASGGRGGNITTGSSNAVRTGAGGAGGPNGAGGNGTDTAGTTPVATDGGAGDAGSGGAGGTLGAETGGKGTEYSASYGCGGGGRGGGSNTAGSGGNYGGGGGGVGTNAFPATSGAGIQGLIVVTYTPGSSSLGNLPMLGM
jgi:hypothetical protein